MHIIHRFRTLLRDTRGLSTVEYVIILALIAVGGISFWQTFGGNVTQKITESSGKVKALDTTGGGGGITP
jgi:Flp pilus assembly pilin Flp